jgi:hypothetical protein
MKGRFGCIWVCKLKFTGKLLEAYKELMRKKLSELFLE